MCCSLLLLNRNENRRIPRHSERLIVMNILNSYADVGTYNGSQNTPFTNRTPSFIPLSLKGSCGGLSAMTLPFNEGSVKLLSPKFCLVENFVLIPTVDMLRGNGGNSSIFLATSKECQTSRKRRKKLGQLPPRIIYMVCTSLKMLLYL